MEYSPFADTLGIAFSKDLLFIDAKRRVVARIDDAHQDFITSLLWKKRDIHDIQCSRFFTCSLDKNINYFSDFKKVQSVPVNTGWLGCMALSSDDSCLVAGSMSDVISAWDPVTLKNLWVKENCHNESEVCEQNSVKCLAFENIGTSIFASGSRNGSVRLWDLRTSLDMPIAEIENNAKNNTLEMSCDDQMLMISNRNSTISLYDIRKIFKDKSLGYRDPSLDRIRTFNEHESERYYTASKFMNYSRNIVTGSEDGYIYVYDTSSGAVEKKLHVCPSAVVHIVDSTPDLSNRVEIVSSIIENRYLHFWSPQVNHVDMGVPAEENDIDFLSQMRKKINSDILLKYSDRLLYLFHKHNRSFPTSWQDLKTILIREHRNVELVQLIRDMIADVTASVQEIMAQSEYTDEENQNTINSNESEQNLHDASNDRV